LVKKESEESSETFGKDKYLSFKRGQMIALDPFGN